MQTVDRNKSDVCKGFAYNWHAIYTRPCHEKKINEQLYKDGVVSYLPVQTVIRQWSDRKKKIDVPLFSCYVFVFVSNKEYYKVLNLPGVVRYVTFEGKAVCIPEKQINCIKNILNENVEVSVIDEKIGVGKVIEITTGPLIGLNGELVEYANSKRVIIRLNGINKMLMVNIPLSDIKNCNKVNYYDN